MQSENFDKKVRDSLSQRPPGSDNPAWDKMEPLLDRHMPREKKDRRRIFFILFAFLLLGGGAFFIWQNNRENNNNITTIGSEQTNSLSEKTTGNPDNDPTAGTSVSKENGPGVTTLDSKDQSTINPQKPGDKTTALSASPWIFGIYSCLIFTF